MKRFYIFMIVILLFAVSANSIPLSFLDDPIMKLLANSGVDVVYDGTYVWIGTSKGLSGTDNGGMEWRSYDSTNGLITDEISAMAYGSGELWVANSSSILSQGVSVPVGEGFSVTSNFGDNFQSYTPFQASSPGMLCYDLDVFDSVVYAACFYGGLIYSTDNGQTWENLYPDTLAEQDFLDSTFAYLNNRFFSVHVDGNYEDTVVVWAGSAAGMNQFQFIDRPGKLASNNIIDFAIQDDYIWVATDLGLSRSENNGISYGSYFASDGLTSDYTSASAANGDFVICAGYDVDSGTSTGFAYSTDFGETWIQRSPVEALGAGNKVEDILITLDDNGGRSIWAACTEGGLIRSQDDGQTWQKITLNAAETSPDSSFNQILSLANFYSLSDQQACTADDTLYLFAGSAGGLWKLEIPCPFDGSILNAELFRFDGIENAGLAVEAVGASSWEEEEGDLVDTVYEWAVATRPHDGQGGLAVLLSQDFGQTWIPTFIGDNVNDLIYTDFTIWLATRIGLQRYNRSSATWIPVEVSDAEEETIIDTAMTTLLFDDVDSLFWVGSVHGLASSPSALPGLWSIDTVNLDQSKFDYNIRATSGDEQGLSGNFAVSVEAQYHNDQRYVWVAGNSTGLLGERNGINVSTDNGQTWDVVLTGINAWNFAFNGADVYAATSAGLMRTSDFGQTWDTLQLVDAATGERIYEGTEFFGVGIADGVIWAASNDGMAKSTDGGESWSVYRTFEEIPENAGPTAYASPVPSSPFVSPGGRVKFHYRFEQSGSVTIKVYDFAMDLVATPVDGEQRAGGIQHDGDAWDMRNDNGDIVATGPYYFKVENSSGEEAWGKIMVIP
ncbi:MAG: hypothetical protein GWO41_14305 [candidate division Zixibacteria bacterium]|nr:hypothetical protein [candidate division Zixibacteria bacterium]NIR63417.1 hypothetical protein [candidate division Zixibacteria bacterium]NIS17563.1 hypothetical protein [candidate division Zixibacteria bacterium]NIS45525.1 hypothetical protein [candidate division Zixibacteria bacterium]NIT53866.1 hypothetical protein [candidate division Zixibacteria bacterium]